MFYLIARTLADVKAEEADKPAGHSTSIGIDISSAFYRIEQCSVRSVDTWG